MVYNAGKQTKHKNIAVLLGFDVGNILGTSWYQGLIALQGSAACWTRLMGFMAV